MSVTVDCSFLMTAFPDLASTHRGVRCSIRSTLADLNSQGVEKDMNKKIILSAMLLLVLFSGITHARYWDCTVSVNGSDMYGIRKGITSNGFHWNDVTIEIEANSRSQAENKAGSGGFSYKKKGFFSSKTVEVCGYGGIDDRSCSAWVDDVACRAQ